MHLLTKCLTLAVFFAAGAFAQNCQIGAPDVSPLNPTACQEIRGYTGTNLTYLCRARSIQPTTSQLSVTAATNASPTVLTSTGHGFNVSSLPLVKISGGTGNWTPINGTWTATVIDANTFSIPVNAVSLGALTGTIIATTTAPRTTQAVWSVLRHAYDGSNNRIWSGFVGGSTAERNTCSAAPTQAQ